MKDMKVLGIIPARGGSKGIPGKNIRPLGGKPLLAWTAEAARRSTLLTRLILSSDSEEIIDVAKGCGVEVPFVRPESLARDDTPALPVVQHAVRHMSEQEDFVPDIIVLLQPTSPLRRTIHIDESLQRLMSSDADSIVSVVKAHHNYTPDSEMILRDGCLKAYASWEEKNNIRQLKPAYYARNCAIYAFTHGCLVGKNSIYGEKILPYEMAREESVDVDDLFDLELCEFLLARRRDGHSVTEERKSIP
jgi:N-acylneuraminate cytidylyltransferase